jgi:hypothetical protein
MSETIRFVESADQRRLLVCDLTLRKRHTLRPLARLAADGLHFWCKDCKGEHPWPWSRALSVMGQVVPTEECLALLWAACSSAGAHSWRESTE